MSIITKSFHKCDDCGKLFEIENKKGYDKCVGSHVQFRKIVAWMEKNCDDSKTIEIFDKIVKLSNGIEDVSSYVKEMKNINISPLKSIFFPDIKKGQDLYDFVSNNMNQITNTIECNPVIDKIELRKAYGKFSIDMRVDFSRGIHIYDKQQLKQHSVKYRQHYYTSIYRYGSHGSGKVIFTLNIGETEKFPILEKFVKLAYTKSKLKTNSKKFSKNLFRLDTV